MERNLAEHAGHLHRGIRGATATRTDDLVIADSGLDDETFNIVAAARLALDTTQRRISETLELLHASGRVFS